MEANLESNFARAVSIRNLDTDSETVLPIASCSDRNGEVEPGEKAEYLRKGLRQRQRQRHWWGECQPHVRMLREALSSSAPDIAVLGPLQGCFSVYMNHLHNGVLSSDYAKTMISGPNVTPLESAFMWLGGWRPTSALVLVYSLMGIELENALETVRSGRDTHNERPTTSVLSTRQLSIMQMLQKHTQLAEIKITKKLTVLQMLITDQDMLEAVLLDAASATGHDASRVRKASEKRMCRFRRLVVQAEELRLHTLQDLLSLLTPVQAARCGIAVFELCFSLRNQGRQLARIGPVYPIIQLSSNTLLPLAECDSLPVTITTSVESIPSTDSTLSKSGVLVVSFPDETLALLTACDRSSLPKSKLDLDDEPSPETKENGERTSAGLTDSGRSDI